MRSFEWANATTVNEVVARGRDAIVKAGGVDLMDLLKERLIDPKRLVNLRTVPGLDRIAEIGGGLRVGPMVTLARLASDPIVTKKYRALAEACGHAATPQIRNMATVGGNLLQRPRCWYFRNEQFPCRKKGGTICYAQHGENQYHAVFDNQACAAVHASSAACALVALGAELEIVGPNGARKQPLEPLFTTPEAGITRENTLGDADVITEIAIPAPAPNASSAYVKLSEKESFDWPLVEVAAMLELDGNVCRRASVVMGAVAHTPRRARAVEQALTGKGVDEAAARAAAALATQGATPLAENGYKLGLIEVAVRRAILTAASTNGGAR